MPGLTGANDVLREANFALWRENIQYSLACAAAIIVLLALGLCYTGESSNQKPTLRFYLNGIKSLPNEPGIPEPPRRPADLSTARMLAFGHPLDWPEDTPNFHGSFLRGDLDEVFIIEGALTQNQITRIYQKDKYTP